MKHAIIIAAVAVLCAASFLTAAPPVRRATPATTTATSKAAVTSKPGVVDLIKLLDPEKDCDGRKWAVSPKEILTSDDTNGSKATFPYQPPTEYDLTVEFTRSKENLATLFILSQGKRQFGWEIFQGSSHFYELVDKVDPRKVRQAKVDAAKGQQHSILFQVRKEGLCVTMDGKVIGVYLGDFSEYRNSDYWGIKKGFIGLGSHGGPVTFTSVKLREIGESGSSGRN